MHISEENEKRRKIIFESYCRALAEGDRNVYFVDGSEFFAGDETFLEKTVDRCHPTDDGFREMADHIGALMKNVFPWENMK